MVDIHKGSPSGPKALQKISVAIADTACATITTTDLVVAVPGVKATDVVMVNTDDDLIAGLAMNVTKTAADAVTVRFTNPTAAGIQTGTPNLSFSVSKKGTHKGGPSGPKSLQKFTAALVDTAVGANVTVDVVVAVPGVKATDVVTVNTDANLIDDLSMNVTKVDTDAVTVRFMNPTVGSINTGTPTLLFSAATYS